MLGSFAVFVWLVGSLFAFPASMWSDGAPLIDFDRLVFCSPPEGAICPICSTHLQLGSYGGKPIVVARKKKKWRDGINGKGKEVA